MVIHVQTENVRDGSLMELLCGDGLVLCGESLTEVTEKYGRWKSGRKGSHGER